VYNSFYFRFIVAGFLLLGAMLSCAQPGGISPGPDTPAADTPANASYLLENNWIQLENGRAEWQAAPGSASKVQTSLFGGPTFGDLNNDGSEDGIIFLTYQGGGSGTFFYLAAALLENGTYRGTNGIWLGDRIGPPAAKIQNGLVTVTYADRNNGEAMTATPSVLQSRYFILDNFSLLEIRPAGDETVYQGWLAIGPELRSFSPCDENAPLWLLGKSTALDAIIAAYGKTMAGYPPYTPVFVILSGRRTAPPDEGFGSVYKEGFFAAQLVKIWPKGNCRSDFILLDSPLPGAAVSSPLAIKGRARGTWFFEGDFPVSLLDAQGKEIAVSYASAKGEWMTTNFVDFEGIIRFADAIPGQQGTLVLKKDNPTGMPQFDDVLRIPVNFE